MNRIRSLGAAVTLLCTALWPTTPMAADNQLTDEEREAGWVLLFDGKSTHGWMSPKRTPLPASHVQDGALNPHPCDYMLVQENVWDDFQLALDFRISERCNSGVFIRTLPLEPRPGLDVGYNGIEIAIDDTTTAGFHDTGAIYDLSKPTGNRMKPAGSWNHLIITCDRNIIDVELNGERVNHIDLDQWTQKNRRPDGSEHKFDVVYKHHPRRGYIGLQDHGADCWFKNIKLLPLGGFATTSVRTKRAADRRVPILGWHSIPEKELSLERFQELADMGLTHSLMHYSPEGNRKALDLARQTGVQLFVGDPRFHQGGAELAKAVAEYRGYPALAGYLLRDEPSTDAFGDLAAVRDELAAQDGSHWSYVNLLPTYASPAQLGCETYPGHVRRFLFEFRPQVLSFDHYPILEGGRLRQDFYRNLEWIRRTSLDFDVPFWAFALTCPHKPYPMPTPGHIRLQAWSNFAYGAKGLQYFTYWTPSPGRWDFHDAPIKLDGTRSATYDLLRRFNRDVQACADVILDSRVVAVFHTEPLPPGTRGLDASSPFRKIEGGEALVGVHVLPDGRRYALVVNRSFTSAAKLDLTLAEWVRTVTWDHPVQGVSFLGISEPGVRLELEPGAGTFLRISERRLNP